jgi:hypothetical protein
MGSRILIGQGLDIISGGGLEAEPDFGMSTGSQVARMMALAANVQ